jgi:hypothetical protein
MIESSDFRTKRMPLNHRAGHMPVLWFGTLIPEFGSPANEQRRRG